jgi:hypothetical protein
MALDSTPPAQEMASRIGPSVEVVRRPESSVKLPWLFALAACLLSAHPAQAQTCAGGVPIDHTHNGAVTIPIAVSSYTNAIGAGLIVGGDPLFFGAGGAFNHDKNLNGNDGIVQAVLGGQIPADAFRRVVVCPTAAVTYEFGTPLFSPVFPDATAGDLNVSGGVQIGFTVYHAETFQVVPTAGFYLASEYFWLNSQRVGNTANADTFGRVTAGVGLVLGSSAITPTAVVQVGTTTGTHAGFQISYSFGFGH